jgi:alginate O-acetyltransferase complex protein AlgI
VIFHSLEYLALLAAVCTLYWLLPHRGQNLLLLGASYLFYGYVHPWFLILILLTSAVDYACGLGIAARPRWRKRLLFASLGVNLGLLGVFKYFGFFVENAGELLRLLGLPSFTGAVTILLPVGISFYTFQSMSYVVDVYRGDAAPRRSFLDYALFVSFFPQLVAGPIERAPRLLGQVEKPRYFDPDRVRDGLSLMLWGFFKKLVIADNVAVVANKVFALESPWFPLLWAGVFAFCIQIYADFSGYTDIARGSARLLGFELMENFNHPYLARSPAEFWRRWHISLSTWFRDYVYIPLGGSRAGSRRAAFNLGATFLLSGLWHGASWNFVLWGLYWGALIWIYREAAGRFPAGPGGLRAPAALQTAWMFLLTNVGWLLFRERNLEYLGRHLSLSPLGLAPEQWQMAGYLFCLALIYSLPLWLHAFHDFRLRPWLAERTAKSRAWRTGYRLGVTAVAMLLFLGILLLRSSAGADFIYFQF